MKILKYISQIFFVSVISLIFVLYFLHIYAYCSPIQNNIIQVQQNENLTAKMQEIIDNISNHIYIKGEYDCKNFSHDLVLALKKTNISAFCVEGLYYCDGDFGFHSWVQAIIDNKTYNIESTTGEFVNETDYKRCYHSFIRGYCL